jgi:hypothetical protein
MARRERAKREMKAFAFDPDRLLAAAALTCRPSTVKTKAAVLAATFPHLSQQIRPHADWARKRLMMASGRPVSARLFSPVEFAAVCRDFPDKKIARACRVLWATASRAGDLRHFRPTKLLCGAGAVWKITFEVIDSCGRLRAPKGAATRVITKWIPAVHEFDPTGLDQVTWADVDSLTKVLGCTPHSIRQTASRHLEALGFSELDRAALTGHAVSGISAPGVRFYSTGSWADPQSKLALRQAHLLIQALALGPCATDTTHRS